MINWKVRFFNKTYWLSLIPAVLLLIQVVCALFGYTLEMGELGNKLMAVVNAVFGALVTFSAPYHDLHAENGNILESGVNYAVLGSRPRTC